MDGQAVTSRRTLMCAPRDRSPHHLAIHPMNDESQSYKVSATSHIACVKFTITTVIGGKNVADVLADGVLYNTQRAAASKAVKAMGGGKRAEIAYSEENRQIIADALKSLFPDADIETSEYIKGASAPAKKFAYVRSLLADKKGQEVEIADRAGFAGDIFDATGDYTSEFLAAVEARVKKLA